MRVRKAILLILTFLFYIPVLAQVDTAWVRRYNGLGNSIDRPTGIAVDKNGNVYITGQSWGINTVRDYATIKYAPNGETLWVRRYNAQFSSDDRATALAVDDGGNVYVTGASWNGNSNVYITIKYSPQGDTLWARRYSSQDRSSDLALDLAIDSSGNIYVTGYSGSTASLDKDYTTVKYDSNGNALWVWDYNGGVNSFDKPNSIAVDRAGNVYVTGESGSDYATVKYSTAGQELWARRYYAPYGGASDLAVDEIGNVYVTGVSAGDYATIKYSPNGNSLWVARYDGPANNVDGARALAVDDNGNVYVTGTSYDGISNDITTIKYTPSGDSIWVRRYNAANSHDIASDLVLDESGNVYVIGNSVSDTGLYSYNFDYVTIKYDSNGDSLWVRRYNGPGNGADYVYELAVDDSGNVYVTGESNGDYVTIKYVQYACFAKAGDVNEDSQIILSDITSLLNSLFKSQPAPNPLCRGDVNVDGKVLLSDIVYLINFLYKSGPAPQKNRECCL